MGISKLVEVSRPQMVYIETEDQVYRLSPEKDSASANDITVSFESKDEKLDVLLSAKTSRVKYVKLRWDQKIGGNIRILGDAWERSYGDLEWKGISSRRTLPWYCLVAGDDGVCGYGVMVRPSAMCYWQIDTQGVSLVLDVRCGGNGVSLNGRVLLAATVLMLESKSSDSFAVAKEFCKYMCEDPILPKIPVYGSNNWYYAYGVSSEKEILADTDYLMKLTKDAPNAPFMVIDDGWEEFKTEEYCGGPWERGNAKFPDMKRLAEQIKGKGAHPGIWIRFLLNDDKNVPENWRLSTNGCLDPTVPEVLDYVRENVYRLTKEWGYELIKHDFSTYDLFGRWGMEMCPSVTLDGWEFHDNSKTSAEVVKMLYQTIYDAAKETDTIILGCNTIGHLGAGLMHMHRSGDDTSGKNWERTRQMGINTLAFRLPQHDAFYKIDADCVGILGYISWFYNRQWADLIEQSGTPLFVSAKPGVLTEEEMRELGEIMCRASKQEGNMIPLDWEHNDTPEHWGNGEQTKHYTWYRPDDDLNRSKDKTYFINF